MFDIGFIKILFFGQVRLRLRGAGSLVGDEFEVILEACRMVLGGSDHHQVKRGRHPYPRTLLTAVIYLTLKEGWSLRQAERWCQENLDMLRQHGWTYRNPPKKSTLHNVMRELDVATVQRISAVVRHLKGEIYLPV